MEVDKEGKCSYIRENIIGYNKSIETPFGHRKITFLDYTASGKSLKFVEDFIEEEILPFYANTHTTGSICGIQTSFYREESRRIILDSVNGGDDDVVLFTGSGSTSAIYKLIQLLGLRRKFNIKSSYNCNYPSCVQSFPNKTYLKLHQRTHTDGNRTNETTILQSEEPSLQSLKSGKIESVVFLSIMEHHSNLLTWREYCDKVIIVPLINETHLDLIFLEEKLMEYKECKVIIGSFTACSNITGIAVDQESLFSMFNKYNGMLCFDYANALSHMRCDMNNKHAIFISPHKFIGGPQTSGVLVVKKKFIKTCIPSIPGGGSVFIVTDDRHWYIQRIEEREESGTPNIVNDIRTGFIFKLYNDIGYELIQSIEEMYIRKAIELMNKNQNIHVNKRNYKKILGDSKIHRSSILSFLLSYKYKNGDVEHTSFYHYNFICTLLNDLFGIQTRGGCMCSGPYSIHLMGINSDDLNLLEVELLNNKEIFRPGYIRLSFPFFLSEKEFDFIIKAILHLADYAYVYLPQYVNIVETGQYIHRNYSMKTPYRNWMSNYKLDFRNKKTEEEPKEIDYCAAFNEYITFANKLSTELKNELYQSDSISPDKTKGLSSYLLSNSIYDDVPAELQWFLIPAHLYMLIHPEYQTSMGINIKQCYFLSSLISKKKDFKIKLNRNLQVNSNKTFSICKSNITSFSNIQKYIDEGYDLKYKYLSELKLYEYQIYVPGMQLKERYRLMKTNKELYPLMPKSIMSDVGRAIEKHCMIQEGDRIVVGISGGKDSLCLLHALLQLQKKAPVKFEVAAITIDPQSSGYNPSPLIDYFKTIGVAYHYISQPIIDRAQLFSKGLEEKKINRKNKRFSICSYCSRMKRGILYTICREYKYNKLALGHHLDDIIESFFMSLYHNSILSTMKANYVIKAKDISVIRPLIYTRENMTCLYSKTNKLPIVSDNCPACFEGPKERYRMKTLLASQEQLYPYIFTSILKAILPLINKTDLSDDEDNDIIEM